jgi:hypothetical protein
VFTGIFFAISTYLYVNIQIFIFLAQSSDFGEPDAAGADYKLKDFFQ